MLEEFLLSGILLVDGGLAAVLRLRLVHVVDWFRDLGAVRCGKSHRVPVIGLTTELGFVHILLLDVRLELRVAVGAAQLRLILLLEVVLLCCIDAAITRCDVTSGGLIVLEELALRLILILHASLLTVHGLLPLEELMLCALS